MGTTTDYDLPYPEGSNPPDVPSRMQTLAEAVDTALGLQRDGSVQLLGAPTGVAATDTAAVQAAIDAAAAAGGGVIQGRGQWDAFPYVVNASIRMKSLVTLTDVSIRLAPSDVDVVTLDSDTVERAGLVRVLIDGNKANQTSSTARGINFVNTSNATTQAAASATANQDPRHLLQDVLVIKTKGDGVRIIGRGESRFARVNTYKCDGRGFHVGSADLTASDCSAGDSGLQGWFFSAAGGADSGSNFKGANLYAWYSGRIDPTHGVGFEIQAKRVQIAGLLAQDNQQHGLAVSGAQDAEITGYVGDSNNNDGTNASSGQNGSGVYMANSDRCNVQGTCIDRNVVPIQRYALEFGSGNQLCRVRLGSRANVGGYVTGDTTGNDVEVGAAAHGVQAVTYAATVTADPYACSTKLITLTGALTLANPTLRHVGQQLRFVLIQDGTGGRVTTFGSEFGVNWAPDLSPSTINTISFQWDGTKWRQESWSTTGTPADPLGHGLVNTFGPGISTSTQLWGSSNEARYARVLAGGSISKIAVEVAVSSGNVSVSVHRRSGSGRSAVPGTRIATSGAVACPATGYQEISLGSTVHVEAGDFLSLSCDNTTASFQGVSGPSSSLFAGQSYAQSSAHPQPATPSSLTPTIFRLPLMSGVA